ncbi:MAG: DUF2760 domain-containing protein [Pseudomonadota bacterium]
MDTLTLALPQTLDLGHIILLAVCVAAILGIIFTKRATPQNNPSEISPVIAKLKVKEEEEIHVSTPRKSSALPVQDSTSALQVLALLQREGRFIDFVQEDLTGFSDADVGAAARVVHEGAKRVIESHFPLQPVHEAEEGTTVVLEDGFDGQSIRLSGAVNGQAPFRGTLVHRGWEVKEIKLPQISANKNSKVIAPAQVEL